MKRELALNLSHRREISFIAQGSIDTAATTWTDLIITIENESTPEEVLGGYFNLE